MDVAAPTASRWQTATIDRVERRTPRVVSVFLRTSLGPFEAGQHVDIRLTGPDGYQAQRSYSIASAPGAPELELAIERLDAGEVSPYFYEIAEPDDTIELRGPIGGHFIWRAEDGGPLLLIGGGSGVVPLISMVRHRANTAASIPTLLVYSARTWDEIIFRDELARSHAQDAALDVVITTTRGPAQRDGDFDRRLDRSLLRDILMRWARTPRHVYVCGSNAFVEAVTEGLLLEGVPAQLIRTERFGRTG